MTSEIWLRNPQNYHRQIAQANHPYTVWSWGMLRQRRIDPVAFSEMAFGELPWETLCVGGKGVTHYRKGDSTNSPTAVYPFFNATDDDPKLLDYLLMHPISGLDQDSLPPELVGTMRPVPGQPHRVVVGYLPPAHLLAGKRWFANLRDLQEKYPEATIHVHGQYRFVKTLNNELKSLDLDPRLEASHGHTMLPVGLVHVPALQGSELRGDLSQYFEMFDMSWSKVYEDAAYRCLYNIKSCVWAGEYYNEELNFRFRKETRKRARHIPITLPEAKARKVELQPQTKHAMIGRRKAQPGDKLSCNHCTLQFACRAYRSGSVCTLPNTDGKRLAAMFGTRDADSVIDGLGQLLVMQANRLQDAMQEEELSGEEGLNPEVSKEIKATFENGKTLAQLLNPALKGGPKVINNNNTGPANTLVVANSNANQLVAGIIRTFEQQGIDRADITTEMISHALAAAGNNRVIEA